MNKKELLAAKENGVNVDKIKMLQNDGNRKNRRKHGKRSSLILSAKLPSKKG
ncbi:MAG: hypothetical protein ABS944_16240 [Solibacillus sp.]|uniref:hypothetical protein n=1 Tax=Solibacillus sp. TaxID=1909654 RepID=UPI003314676F